MGKVSHSALNIYGDHAQAYPKSRPFDVAYPTILDERLWCFRALDYMKWHPGPTGQRVNRQLKPLVDKAIELPAFRRVGVPLLYAGDYR